MEYLTLNNGAFIPAVGIGTFLLAPKDAESAVVSALENGYEMIDTANAYLNEKAVGRGMRRSGVAREKIFLSTKLWPSEYSEADRAIDDTLARLGVDYVDLLFLHQPVGDYVGAYKAMERAVRAGKVKSLGLSNFPADLVDEVIAASVIRPAVLQVEAHPYFPQTKLKAMFPDIRIMAWYPLGHGDRNLIGEEVFAGLAVKYAKSSAQIILRWHVQSGNVVIPGSKNPAHIKDNIGVFDFALTDEEIAKIASLNRNVRYYTATKEALESYLAFAPDFNGQE